MNQTKLDCKYNFPILITFDLGRVVLLAQFGQKSFVEFLGGGPGHGPPKHGLVALKLRVQGELEKIKNYFCKKKIILIILKTSKVFKKN